MALQKGAGAGVGEGGKGNLGRNTSTVPRVKRGAANNEACNYKRKRRPKTQRWVVRRGAPYRPTLACSALCLCLCSLLRVTPKMFTYSSAKKTTSIF